MGDKDRGDRRIVSTNSKPSQGLKHLGRDFGRFGGAGLNQLQTLSGIETACTGLQRRTSLCLNQLQTLSGIETRRSGAYLRAVTGSQPTPNPLRD